MNRNKYITPLIHSYQAEDIVAASGPITSAYETGTVDVRIRATVFNTSVPALYKHVKEVEYKIAKLENHNLNRNSTETLS